ncbi:unnamed protein product [Cuscuta europaea]|uniref:Uncharacterized protein n=1 Tax=Cuscuta europaea TaxID=41803 RepID=A0A9P0Z021_CUSEU|nr:unnamed protein product [Cuscuta europaea]
MKLGRRAAFGEVRMRRQWVKTAYKPAEEEGFGALRIGVKKKGTWEWKKEKEIKKLQICLHAYIDPAGKKKKGGTGRKKGKEKDREKEGKENEKSRSAPLYKITG